jgi:hypothetical protein
MPKVSAAQRKAISEQKARARQAHMLQAKRDGKRDISDKILKQLAALNLPPDKWVYDTCLAALEREYGDAT